MTLFNKILILLAFGIRFTYPQSDPARPEKVYEDFSKGQIEAARSALPGLQSKYPGTEWVMFLDACLEPNGNLALQKYNLFLDKFPRSEQAPEALYRIYQYYYAKGLYLTAQKTGATLLEKYPDSPYEAQLRGEVKDETVEQAVATGDDDADQTDLISSSMIYAVQVGSFRDLNNAERQKFQLKDVGYSVSVAEKLVDGIRFYSVLVGEFRNVDDALFCGKTLKEKFQLSYRVIEKQVPAK